MNPQVAYAGFQEHIGTSLSTLSQRFPNQPGPYAHLLRFMTQGMLRLNRDGEAEKYFGDAQPYKSRQVGGPQSWAAFDHAAAEGERLDPDNAYFPMMRAIGLFDAKRDAEGIAAVLRAGQKSRFEDYSLEEPKAIRALYRRAYSLENALLRESDYVVVLLPHYAALRSLARLTTAKAAQAEHDGHPEEGLALRHALMVCAIRMRQQGTIIGALVAYSIFSTSMHSPGGVIENPPPADVPTEQKHTTVRESYLAYLHRTGQRGEAVWVLREDGVQTATRQLIQVSVQKLPLSLPIPLMNSLWIGEMLLLVNTGSLLCFCGLAVLLGRLKRHGGEKALPWAVLCVMVGSMFLAFQMQWADPMTHLQRIVMSLSSVDGTPPETRITEITTRFPAVVHIGEIVFSLAAPLLVLIVAGAVSVFRKEAFSAALARSLQRGALIFTTLLAATYALMLLSTAHLETRVNGALDGKAQNAVAYLQQQAGSAHKP